MHDVLDTKELLGRVENDFVLLSDMVTIFNRRSDVVLGQLRQHLQHADATGCAKDAHQLAGMLANLSATRALPLARELERGAAVGDLRGANQRCAALHVEVREVGQALAALLRQNHEGDGKNASDRWPSS